MASMRVHELAKEFGMSSKDLLERLEDMKIPAKNHASTLVDAYVDKIRKEMGPELAERAAAIEAVEAKKVADAEAAAEAARLKEEAARKAAEEAERTRREQERLAREAAEAIRAAEKAAREKEEAEEAARIAQAEELARAAAAKVAAATKAPVVVETKVPEKVAPIEPSKEAASAAAKQEKRRPTIPTRKSRYDGLLSQIEAEKTRLAEEEQEKKLAAATKEAERKKKDVKKDAKPAAGEDTEAKHAKGPKKDGVKKAAVEPEGTAGETEGEGKTDRYRKMAQEVEKFQRNKVLEDARIAVEAATTEAQGEGRRKKRKEKRALEAAVKEEAKIEQAIARGEEIVDESVAKVPTGSTVSEFAEIMGVASNDIIKRLFLLGTPLTLTQTISDELIELIASDLNREVRITVPEDEEALVFYDAPDELITRPPVVTVMGHVDHGKTSLLDAIRKTGVVETEAGGITQHIGASVVHLKNRQITFIDTPGHEAFTAMRARGAKVTDVVVLVVAADDGVMPQTVEAINHAHAAGVPIVVAVNKVDKPGADPTRARQGLTEYGIIPEEWGGQNMFVDVSAKQRLNIDDLLETILLQADVLELKANPNTLASGFVIESNLDKGRGPVATMLVHRGTLHVGDALVVGTSYGRVRAMYDPKGNVVTEALPSDPVEVIGLSSVATAGDEFRVFEDERDARNLAEERALRHRRLAEQKKTHISLEDLFARIEEGKTTELNLVVKADVQGSIEALQDALNKMDQSEVRINVIHSAVGGITETDVTLASASDAIIIGFGVRPQPKAKLAAQKEQVDIRTYRVIYKAIEEINAARVGLLSPDIVEKDTGSAEVRSLFRVPKAGVIAGCYVTEGEIARDNQIRIVRNGTVVHEGKISSLRHYKEDVKTIKFGYECGIGIENFQDVKEGDVIEGFRVEEIARKA
ncbi:MAG: translation initiation factor IF-2 [Actinobacteria bacterium]|nr:translation initiation factor IF-2 [Actinomycetota bacterium]